MGMINKPANWDTIEENEVAEGLKMEVGPQPAQIKAVIDHPDKEYIELQFDIVQGKYKDYFKNMFDRMEIEKWPNQGIYRASYKETATTMFKAVITAIQKSNQGYVWNWDPQSLKGKYMVVVYGEEEYEYNGDVLTAVKPRSIRSIEAWKKGDIATPQLKKLKKRETQTNPFATNNFNNNISNDDLPF